MKHLLLFLSLFLFNVVSGQSVNGLGIFKIGVFTEKTLDSLMQSRGFKLSKCNNSDCTNNGNFIKLIPNTEDIYKSPVFSSYSENVTAYKIKNFILNDTYSLKTLYLSFYKGVLYEILVLSPESKLIDDLKTKYGNGRISKEENVSKCYIDGSGIEMPEVKYNTIWKGEGNINMFRNLKKYYGTNCEESYSSYLSVFDSNISDIARSESRMLEKSITDKINEKKKASLKDL